MKLKETLGPWLYRVDGQRPLRGDAYSSTGLRAILARGRRREGIPRGSHFGLGLAQQGLGKTVLLNTVNVTVMFFDHRNVSHEGGDVNGR